MGHIAMSKLKSKTRFMFPKRLLATLVILMLPFWLQGQSSLKVLTFNIWQEGTSVENGMDKIEQVLLQADADLVCFTEVRNYKKEDWTQKIVNRLKKKGKSYYRGYVGGDVSLISKYPITDGHVIYEGEGSVAQYIVRLQDMDLNVACAHLDYTYYACYLPRGYNGGTPNWSMIDNGQGKPQPVTDPEQILKYNLRSERDEQIKAYLKAVGNDKRPLLLLGDFNEPSHLDWVDATRDLFDHNGVKIEWNCSKELIEYGFIDAFREVYPDPVRNPGFTWPAKAYGKETTSWTPLADERDRIDFIYYKGDQIRTKEAHLVGPKATFAYNKLTTSNTENESFLMSDLDWPSDHRAVMCVLEVESDK